MYIHEAAELAYKVGYVKGSDAVSERLKRIDELLASETIPDSLRDAINDCRFSDTTESTQEAVWAWIRENFGA